MVCGVLTIFTAPMMINFGAKNVLVFCALCYAIGLLLFIGFQNYYIIVLGRALCGVSQAWICTYGPVWINEFAPTAHTTIWLGLQ